MNKLTLLFLLLMAGMAKAQTFDLKDLLGFSNLSTQKFEAHVAKKGFKRDYFSPRESGTFYTYFQVKKSQKSEVTRALSFQSLQDKTLIGFHTTSLSEYNDLQDQIDKAGFRSFQPADSTRNKASFFQKEDLAIHISIEEQDTLKLYSLLIEKKMLAKAKDINYAEDLLNLDSHEYLTTVFGSRNVAKDVFYYTETETNKCSVLFPNSNQEVIFIWDDEVNYRGIALLLIGGGLLTKKNEDFNRQVEHNVWRSRQGIYSGMPLVELQELNGRDLDFYGWHLDQAGMLTPRNSGLIDFKKVGVVLNCLNCTDQQYQVNVVRSSEALAENRKIYVSTIIILPERVGAASVSKLR